MIQGIIRVLGSSVHLLTMEYYEIPPLVICVCYEGR